MWHVLSIMLMAAGWAAGCAMIAEGWRGRLVDLRPRCTRCGYELEGTLGVAHRCPECGQALEAARAVRWGIFRSNRDLVRAGFTLVIASFIAAMLYFYAG